MAVKSKKIKVPKVNTPAPNKGLAYRYERAYKKLYEELTPALKERVLQLKKDPFSKDHQSNEFIKQVIGLAESDTEL